MVTAVDTSVLLDVLLDDPQFGPVSTAALRQAASEGPLIIGETALAEVVPVLAPGDLPQFLSDWNLAFVPSSQASAVLAGEMFRTCLDRGGKRGRVVPDFLIAAHGQLHAQRLLARDRGYYRDYFKGLDLWDPTPVPASPSAPPGTASH
jgi:predicted nucleic acid-binding protein